jgi:dTDP-glucose pyrophosphorylase/CBS domain-containing protein
MGNRFVLTIDATLEQAIRQLDANGNGFLPVVDVDSRLIGIITDGDLRRGILNKSLDLQTIINKDPVTAAEGTSHVLIKKRLREIHRRHMPVVDAAGKLIEIVTLDEFEFISKENWVVIMAGGIGSRLGDLTRDIPKPMLLIGGKPILQGIIEHFKNQGFCKFLLCVNYKAEIIEDYFKNGEWLGVGIKYTLEGKRLGTAGALSLIDFEMNAPFFVVNGDVLTAINFEDFLNYHQVNNSDATMCIKKFQFDVPYACVEFNSQMDLTGLKEKPSFDYFVNTGMYILEPGILKEIPKESFFDMPQLFEQVISKNYKTKVFSMEEYWLDLGKPEDFNKGNKDMNRDFY